MRVAAPVKGFLIGSFFLCGHFILLLYYLWDGEHIGALVVHLEICDREDQGAHTETERPHQDYHPPAFAFAHDDGVSGEGLSLLIYVTTFLSFWQSVNIRFAPTLDNNKSIT